MKKLIVITALLVALSAVPTAANATQYSGRSATVGGGWGGDDGWAGNTETPSPKDPWDGKFEGDGGANDDEVFGGSF